MPHAPFFQSPSVSKYLAGLNLFLLAVLFALIWLPELEHYHVPNESLTAQTVSQGRYEPTDEVLKELRAYRFLQINWRNNEQLIASAEKLLEGSAEIPGFAPIGIHLPFDPADLDRGSGLWQLEFSGLAIPEILIDAYRVSGQEKFYDMALKVMLAWANYERSVWLNRGFLWNDHAVAARARTLADFWSVYRHRQDYQPEVARQIWQFAARTAALLAKPELFTFATNHGVMQNLGLWQICIAFPSLPHAREYKQIAFSRLKDQISFYISPEGVVLEHSAFYHEFGLYLFGVALRETTLLHLAPPPEWARKYESALKFYWEVRRPDGSLPPFGDTEPGPEDAPIRVTHENGDGGFGPLATADRQPFPLEVAVYPVSGYAVLWDGIAGQVGSSELTQTVFAWSYFPGHGHKHADEPSVLLWARGHEWWTSAGYWPYDDAGRARAECWDGSNAPHLAGEACISPRTTRLVSLSRSDALFGADVERRGPGDLVIHRLLIHAGPAVWVIVDECAGAPNQNLQTVWTTAPNVRMEARSVPGTYALTAGTNEMRAYFLGPPKLNVEMYRGSRSPFAGWTTSGGRPTPSGAIVTDQPANGAWAVTVWTLGESLRTDASGTSVSWTNPRSWKVYVTTKGGVEVVSRDGEKLSFEGGSASDRARVTKEQELAAVSSETLKQIDAIQSDYRSVSRQYPVFKDLGRYRVRASAIGGLLFVLQELLLIICGRLSRRYLIVLRILALLAWAGLCFWVPLVYLHAS